MPVAHVTSHGSWIDLFFALISATERSVYSRPIRPKCWPRLTASAGIYFFQHGLELLGRYFEKSQCGRRPGEGKLFLLAGGELLLLCSAPQDSGRPVYFYGFGKFGQRFPDG